MKFAKAVSDFLMKLLDVLSIALVVAMVMFLLLQLLGRAFFNHGFFWTEESAKLCLIFLAYLGAAMSSVNGNHISVTILGDALRGTAKKVVFVIQQLIAMAFLVMVFIYSFPALEIASKSVTTNTHINYAIIYSIVPISSFIMFFGHLMKIVVQIMSKEYVKEVDEDRMKEAEDQQ